MLKLLHSIAEHLSRRPACGARRACGGNHSPKIKNGRKGEKRKNIPETIAHHFNMTNIRTSSESLLFFHLLIQFLQHQIHVSVLVQLEVKVLSDGMQREPLWSQLHQQAKVFFHFP